ncbi:MAG: tRNA-intron lyase [Candidatus Bathyarchaeia archaeon]
MGKDKNEARAVQRQEEKIKGRLVEEGVKVEEKKSVEELSSRGYGLVEEEGLYLSFYEALYLMDRGLLEVKDDKGGDVSFQMVLQAYEKGDENAWAKYMVYRDLRGRGYVVRGGFGLGLDFRVYERGDYGKDTAKYLVLSMQEGRPLSLEYLTNVMRQCQALKKELVLAVMSRRGEIVYYTVSQLTVPKTMVEKGRE